MPDFFTHYNAMTQLYAFFVIYLCMNLNERPNEQRTTASLSIIFVPPSISSRRYCGMAKM